MVEISCNGTEPVTFPRILVCTCLARYKRNAKQKINQNKLCIYHPVHLSVFILFFASLIFRSHLLIPRTVSDLAVDVDFEARCGTENQSKSQSREPTETLLGLPDGGGGGVNYTPHVRWTDLHNHNYKRYSYHNHNVLHSGRTPLLSVKPNRIIIDGQDTKDYSLYL